jgi:hypothetical protein
MIGHRQVEPEPVKDRADQLFGLAQRQMKTARSINAVVIARSEEFGCPPGVVRGAAFQLAMAASVNQTVKLPRRRKAVLLQSFV